MEGSTIAAIFVAGVTCSGKSTLSKLLAETLRCDAVFIGEILRSEFPQRVGDVNSEEFFQHIRKKVDQRSTNAIIFDNFPNNLEQYHIWSRYYPAPILTLHIQSQNVLKRKILRNRSDDGNEETISRYSKFVNFTIPVLNHLKEHTHVVEINGDQPPEILLKDATNIIRDIFISKSIPFHDFSTPVICEKFSHLAKSLVKKEPFGNGYNVYLPRSINLGPFQTEAHSTSLAIGVGARSSGFLVGALATKGVLVHPTLIEVGALELNIVFTNLNSTTISINSSTPVATIIFCPTLLPRLVEAEKYGLC